MNLTPGRTSTSGNQTGPVAGVTIPRSAASNAAYAVNAGSAAGCRSTTVPSGAPAVPDANTCPHRSTACIHTSRDEPKLTERIVTGQRHRGSCQYFTRRKWLNLRSSTR